MEQKLRSGDELIAELQAGGSSFDETFRQLFDLYYPRLVRFFVSRSLKHEDCLDLAQETFLGLCRGLHSFRGDAPFDSWIFSIAVNAHRKKRRSDASLKRSGLEISLDDSGGFSELRQPMADIPSPDVEILRRERQQTIRLAIERLPDQLRKCLLLRLGRGLKYREIAAVLGLSVGTVKGYVFAARQRLKAELEAEKDIDDSLNVESAEPE